MRKILWMAVLALVGAASSVLAGEPAGVKLRWDGSVNNRSNPAGTEAAFLFPWGATESELTQKLTGSNAPGAMDAGKPSCWPTNTEKEDGCTLGVDGFAGWFADSGENAFRVTLYFMGGKFYRYSITFPEAWYSDMKQSLITAIGKPKGVVRSTVSNRMGAKFGQETARWTTKSTLVEIEHLSDTVEEGDLTVTYKPILVSFPRKPKTATKAPF